MSLSTLIETDFREAIKSSDAARRMVLSMLKSSLHNRAIEKRKKDVPFSDEEVLDVILTEIKKRKDAAKEYVKASREELAKKEEAEAAMLMKYLPPQISDAEVRAQVKDAVARTGALSAKDTGKVLAVLAPALKGKADMSQVAQIVKEVLSR